MTVTLPDKPKRGAPCNGCGLCCALELCLAGKLRHGPEQLPPCPSLKVTPDHKRTYCEVVAFETLAGLPPLAAEGLGIGLGCGMDDMPEGQGLIAWPKNPLEDAS